MICCTMAHLPPPDRPFRYRLTLAYLGTPFAGWQRQANAPTVQAILEEALTDLVGERVTLHGAGRTDAGVHARGQVAHLDLARPFPPDGLVLGGNFRLPETIRLLAAELAPPGFHAQFSAVAKEYRYRFYRARRAPPELLPWVTLIPAELDLEALAAATLHLPGQHDFSAFALAGATYRTSLRTLYRAAWEGTGAELALAVVGDGFLRGMVRGLAGTLLEVARRRRSVADFARLLAGSRRGDAGPTAPARGLTLERVDYPPAAPGSPGAAVVT